VGWTRRESGATNYLSTCSYLNGQFFAVGELGTILTSPDAVTWTKIDSGTSNRLGKIAFGNGSYVVVGANGLILRSTDAVAWQRAVSGTKATLLGITFGNDTFVAVGEGQVLCSSDGISWTATLSVDVVRSLSAVEYGGGQFVVVGYGLFAANVSRPILNQPRLANGAFEFLIDGEKGRSYRVQTATRLSPPDWIDLVSITNTQVSVPFSDTNYGIHSHRFYRTWLNE
jgi:hypothetical protein